MALEHISKQPTSKGKELSLTAEQEKNCKVLYRKNEDNLYEFAGFYDPDIPDEDYPDGFIALCVNSVFGGIERLEKGTAVYNVIGSTHDPWNNIKNPSWIAIWEQQLKEKGHPNDKKCYVAGSAGIFCNNSIYGGHVVKQVQDTRPSPGVNGIVHIVPICNAHNNRSNINAMTISEDVYALVLNKYHE